MVQTYTESKWICSQISKSRDYIRHVIIFSGNFARDSIKRSSWSQLDLSIHHCTILDAYWPGHLDQYVFELTFQTEHRVCLPVQVKHSFLRFFSRVEPRVWPGEPRSSDRFHRPLLFQNQSRRLIWWIPAYSMIHIALWSLAPDLWLVSWSHPVYLIWPG